jgi:PmbA protein
MLGQDKINQILKPYLESKEADEIEATYYGIDTALTRYANTITHQTMQVIDQTATFRVIKNGSIGVAGTNTVTPEGLNQAFKNAINIAERKKPTKNFPGLPSPSGVYQKIDTFIKASYEAGQQGRINGIKKVFDLAKKHGLNVAGRFQSGANELLIANSKGINAYQPSTFFDMSNIVMHPTFSAHSGAIGRDMTKVDFNELAETAVQKTLKGINPGEIEVGKYDVVLEPAAFGEVMEWLGYIGFTSRSLEEGTGFMFNKLGQKLLGDNITVYDDAFDTRGIAAPFDFEGVPKQKVVFVEKGVANDVVYDTYSGFKAGKNSTGHSLGAKGMAWGAMPLNIIMTPGDKSLAEIIKSVERGVLVTRFHYVNGYLHTPTAKMTGMTRDGLFWIENGEIKNGLKNMRWTDSMVRVLNNIAAITKEVKTIPAWWGESGAFILPGVLIKDFEFTGKSDH